jgi:hypothetical protein
VGPEHLIGALLLLGVVACGGSQSRGAVALGQGEGSRVSLGAATGSHGAHMQIVRAMPSAERAALVERFRARNGPSWTVMLGAGGAPDDVEPIRGILRRAKREGTSAGAFSDGVRAADVVVTEESAVAEAGAFLAKNAEFFGFATSDVPALDLVAGPAKTSRYGAWVVHARGRTPMLGYEGFESLTSMIDVLVYIGDDGTTRYFVNLSRIHPHLLLDTRAGLGPDDKRLLTNVLGRPLFVVVDDPNRPNARVRELRRVSVGTVVGADVRAIRLTIYPSPGPRGVYMSYRLAYAIDVTKERNPFRFVVDADTGDLLDDAVVPVVPATAAQDEED